MAKADFPIKIKHDYSNARLTREVAQNEKILAYLTGEDNVKLSKKEKEQLDRYSFAEAQLRRFKNRNVVAKMMAARYGISLPQAYRDINNTKIVFGSSVVIDKDYYRAFLLDSIVETINMAVKDGDLRAKNAAEKNLIVLLGFDKDDSSPITPDMLQQNVLVITPDIAALGLPKVDDLDKQISKFLKDHPEDVDEQ
jgi:hypothetical protein